MQDGDKPLKKVIEDEDGDPKENPDEDCRRF